VPSDSTATTRPLMFPSRLANDLDLSFFVADKKPADRSSRRMT
jgi:hypothetical protein